VRMGDEVGKAGAPAHSPLMQFPAALLLLPATAAVQQSLRQFPSLLLQPPACPLQHAFLLCWATRHAHRYQLTACLPACPPACSLRQQSSWRRHSHKERDPEAGMPFDPVLSDVPDGSGGVQVRCFLCSCRHLCQ